MQDHVCEHGYQQKRNNYGTITYEELKIGLTRLGSKLSENEVKQLMEAVSILSSASYLSTSPHNDYITFAEVCLLDVLLLWCSGAVAYSLRRSRLKPLSGVCSCLLPESISLVLYGRSKSQETLYVRDLYVVYCTVFIISKIIIHGRLGFNL